jgi:hypothetical protein
MKTEISVFFSDLSVTDAILLFKLDFTMIKMTSIIRNVIPTILSKLSE